VTPDTAGRLAAAAARTESVLATLLPAVDGPEGRLAEAMRYAVLGPGKRLRPFLVFEAGSVLGIEADRLERAACALECVHAYSLVHDDLPCMDDDDLRRGRPTVHRAFDEATARPWPSRSWAPRRPTPTAGSAPTLWSAWRGLRVRAACVAAR